MNALYALVESYFPSQCHYLSGRYQTMPFPANEIVPPGKMSQHGDLGALLGFIDRWSSVRRYAEAQGDGPVSRKELTSGPPVRRCDRHAAVTWGCQ